MQLVACFRCRRHVEVSSLSCPFCGATVPPARSGATRVAAGRLSRAAIFAGATLGASCWTSSTPASTTTTGNNNTPVEPVGRGTIRGQIIERHGNRPWNGVWIALTGPNGLRRVGETDMEGRFVFDGLAPGSYTLHTKIPPAQPRRRGRHDGVAKFSDWDEVSRAVELAASGNAEVTWELDVPQPDPIAPDMPYGAPPARRRLV